MTRDDTAAASGSATKRACDGGDREWTVLESVAEYETGWYTGGYDEVVQPDGSTKRYYWAALPPAVVVVPLLDDEVVFVEQYRPAIRQRCLELPAGIVERVDAPDGESVLADETGSPDADEAGSPDADEAGSPDADETGSPGADEADAAALAAVTEAGRESYEAAGARELREEAGYDPDAVTRLETVWCSTGVLRHRRGVVVAEGLDPVERELDSNEFLTVTRHPRDEALAVARDRPANDATLEALLLAAADGYL